MANASGTGTPATTSRQSTDAIPPQPRPPRSTSQDHMQVQGGPGLAPASPRPAPKPDSTTRTEATAGFYDMVTPTADASENPVCRDGRLRVPVLAKTSAMSGPGGGTFGILRMDVSGKNAAAERDAAAQRAKRTSESTQLAAAVAYQTGNYVPPRRNRLLRVVDLGDGAAKGTAEEQLRASADPAHADSTASSSSIALSGAHARPNGPLSPAETKVEQARLLTLLRSLQPAMVVDQLCKALAYFGGIPDAPPPQDGRFPVSETSNGPGQLFIGWIAEIFPRLGSAPQDLPPPPPPPQPAPAVAEPPPPPQQQQQHAGLRRQRGRPKGSKASKPRRDKGIKKGPKTRLETAAAELATSHPGRDGGNDEGDGSWIDVEDGSIAHPDTHAAVADASGPMPTPSQARQAKGTPVTAAATEVQGVEKSAASSRRKPKAAGGIAGAGAGVSRSSAGSGHPAAAAAAAAETPRRRGRPPGSKNKPKEAATPSGSVSVPTPIPPLPIPIPGQVVSGSPSSGFLVVQGSETAHAGPQSHSSVITAPSTALPTATKVTDIPPPPIPGLALPQKPKAPRRPARPATANPVSAPSDTATATAAGGKAKRKRAAKEVEAAAAPTVEDASSQRTQPPVTASSSSNVTAAPALTNASARPAKRPRKSKEATSIAAGGPTPDLATAPVPMASQGAAASQANLESRQPQPFSFQSPTFEPFESQTHASRRGDGSLAQQLSNSQRQPAHEHGQRSGAPGRLPTPGTSQKQHGAPHGSQFVSRPEQQHTLSMSSQDSPPTNRPQYSGRTTTANYGPGPGGGYDTSPSSSFGSVPAARPTSTDGRYRLQNGQQQQYAPLQQQQQQQQQQQRQHQQQQHYSQSPPILGSTTAGAAPVQQQRPRRPPSATQQMPQHQAPAAFQGYGDAALFDMSGLTTPYGGGNGGSSGSAATVPRGDVDVDPGDGSFSASQGLGGEGSGLQGRYYGVGSR